MKVIIASTSPVKEEAVKKAFAALFPSQEFTFECVKANSGISDQPMSDDETRTGALGRVAHARTLASDADFYAGLEGGVEEKYGDMYNFGWAVVESKDSKRGFGRTFAFVVPPGIRHAMLHEGLELSVATDKTLSKSGTRSGSGTIGHLTNDFLRYIDWYLPAVISALVPFVKTDLY